VETLKDIAKVREAVEALVENDPNNHEVLAETSQEIADQITERITAHPIWQNDLVAALRSGSIPRENLKIFLEQHYLYSLNFVSFIGLALSKTGLTSQHQSILIDNANEELGLETGKPHTELLADLLIQQFGSDIANLEMHRPTEKYVRGASNS